MSTLDKAMPTVFFHEGRFSNVPGDSGGPTMYGISLSFLRQAGVLSHDKTTDGDIFDINHDGVIDIKDILSITPEKATEIYKVCFWDVGNYQSIKDQSLATKTFDIAINTGSTAPHKCLQRAVKAASGCDCIDDGILGPTSISLINACDPKILLAALKSEIAGYYRSLALKCIKSEPKKFIHGWLNRAYSDMLV